MAASFYPRLSSLVNVDNIPEELRFVQEGLQSVLDKIYYKNLQFVKSDDGSQAYYNLVLVCNNDLSIDILGSGFSLILNPANSDETIIPISLNYSWPILGFTNSFDLTSFPFSPSSFQNLLNLTLTVDDIELIETAINIFEGGADEVEDYSEESYKNFVDKINVYYNLSGSTLIPYPQFDLDNVNALEDIRASIEANSGITDSISEIVSQIYIQSADSSTFLENINRISLAFFEESIEDYIKKIIIHRIDASLELAIGLAVPRNVLMPLTAPVAQGGQPLAGTERAVLVFDVGTFTFSTVGGFGFNKELEISLNHPCQIGNTGLGIEFTRAKLDLSSNTNIAEANLDGRPNSFIGLYVEKVNVSLPSAWFNNVQNSTLQISGYNLLIGSGGVSGTIALETVNASPVGSDDYLYADLGTWSVGFHSFNVTFKQNAIVNSDITGVLKIPKLKDGEGNDAEIFIGGHFNENGDFSVTASEPQGIPFNLFDFVHLNFLSLELGRQDDDFYIGTSCEIWFTNAIMTKLIGDQKIVLPNVRVYSDGSIEIVGGNAFIPANISLDLGPVEVAVTGIHFGSYEQNGRKYNYWGFDGAISINPLGIDARGEGIKYYYTIDNDEHGGNGDSFIRIQTIEVDLIIPGNASPAAAAAIIHGMISIPQPGESPEYVGEVSIKLPKAKIAGGASMKLQPKAPAFIIDAYVDLPAPIPIGPVGIYGFRGLIGYRYVAEKEAVGLVSGVNTWYDYYKFPPRGIHVKKFSGPERTKDYNLPFSIGVGAVLGTSFDSGTIISIRAMMVLSLPTLFMIDGRASIISARLGLDDTKEPPFFAFVAWGDNSIEMGMGADFKLPQSTGKILSLQAQVESRFDFNNASAWYVNIGTKQNPNTATVFKDLINLRALSYLMIAAQGIEAGARVDFELKKNFFGIKVEIYAFVEMGGHVSFERPQMGGYLHFGGGIKVNVWRVLFIGFDMNAYLSAEAVKPFLIFAKMEFHGRIKVLRFLKIRFSIRLQLKWEVNSEVDTTPVFAIPYQNDPSKNVVDRSEELVKGVHMLTNDTYNIKHLGVNLGSVNPDSITDIIPLDTYIDIKSTKGLIGNALSSKIGGYTSAPSNYSDLIPPQKTVAGGHVLRQVKHQYSIDEIEIKAYNGSQWVSYHPYEALFENGPQRAQVSNLRIGYWQRNNNQYDTIRLMATTPFSYLDSGEPGWFIPEYYGITPSTLFCQIPYLEMEKADVLNKTLGTIYYHSAGAHYINGVYFRPIGDYGTIDLIETNGVAVDTLEVTNEPNPHGFEQSLSFTNYNSLAITLPKDSAQVELKLTSNSEGLKIKYYKTFVAPNSSTTQFELVSEITKTQFELSDPVIYNNPSQPVIKIVVEPVMPMADEIAAIREQIEELFADTYSSSDGVVSISLPRSVRLYNELQEQLIQLLSTGCSATNNGGETPCANMDVLLCDIYQTLVENYCFENITSVEELNIECYTYFIQIIKNSEASYPGLITLSQPYYTDYVNLLQTLKGLISSDSTPEQIISVYNHLYTLAHQIMQTIYEAGNCGCATQGDNSDNAICTTSFQEIRWLSVQSYEFNALIPGADAQMQDQLAMQDAVEHTVQPVWRPNTKYYIRFKLTDKVNDTANNTIVESRNYFYGFKTSGGVGHYVQATPQKGLNSLAGYLDFNRSYPNADGNLLQAKPLFWGHYECKISLFFTKPFTYHMLNAWAEYNGLSALAGSINIKIKDPVSGVLIPYPLPVDYNESTVPIPVGSNNGSIWSSDDNPLIPAGLGLLNNLIESANLPCELHIGDPLAPASYVYTVKLTNLKPQKLYTALVYSAFDSNSNGSLTDNENIEIHNFVFQTSRYENFASQIYSYRLSDGDGHNKDAVFKLPVSLGAAAIQNAYDIVSGNNVNVLPQLSEKYSHAFDRVLEGIFLTKPLEFPATTEFNVIRDEQAGNIIAILVRNPEPFNNPKIPVADMQDTLVVLNTQSEPDVNFKVLFSKDYSQAIIMKEGSPITGSTLSMRFRYKTWNGTSYTQEGTDVPVTINL